jgi:hypothetical protein
VVLENRSEVQNLKKFPATYLLAYEPKKGPSHPYMLAQKIFPAIYPPIHEMLLPDHSLPKQCYMRSNDNKPRRDLTTRCPHNATCDLCSTSHAEAISTAAPTIVSRAKNIQSENRPSRPRALRHNHIATMLFTISYPWPLDKPQTMPCPPLRSKHPATRGRSGVPPALEVKKRNFVQCCMRAGAAIDFLNATAKNQRSSRK